MDPDYHAEDPFRIIERIGEVFVLVHYPAGRREYAIWRANLHIEGRSFDGETFRALSARRSRQPARSARRAGWPEKPMPRVTPGIC
jgi:hypothetical protein